jgi:pyruvate dehydrogenase E2 component (dihydrolipoamide acetyltransferase)
MATKVLMEALSPTMTEGRVTKWLKHEGDPVKSGETLAEVETDKAVMELVSRGDGVLRKVITPEGTTVEVGSLVAVVAAPDEDISTLASGSATPKVAPPAQSTPRAEPKTGAPPRETGSRQMPVGSAPVAPAAPSRPAAPAPAAATATTERVKASPLARRMAQDRGVDLTVISGSGPGGRIIKRDLEGAAAARLAPAALRAPAGDEFQDVPLTQIRKTIAKRLVQSLAPIPHFFLTTEIDMERAWDAREALNGLKSEQRISFNDIIVKVVALALTRHPECNAWWQEDHIRYFTPVHIGMAVAIDEGLITPVIRDAHAKSLREIATESRDLVERARARKLKPDEYTGSTFSVSNLGMFDIDQFTAVINPPEAGILAVGSIGQHAVVQDGEVSVRRRLRVTMSCDHRVIDGAMGARFLQTVKQMLENPLAMVW